MKLSTLAKSTGKKRGLGALIVMVPMIIKYAIKVSNAKAGTSFEIDDDLLNILFGVGTVIWSGGVIHAYLPKVLAFTIKAEKALENFNAWAKKVIGGKR